MSLTEGTTTTGPEVQFCRFCGRNLCNSCGIYRMEFIDGEYRTKYFPGKDRPVGSYSSHEAGISFATVGEEQDGYSRA